MEPDGPIFDGTDRKCFEIRLSISLQIASAKSFVHTKSYLMLCEIRDVHIPGAMHSCRLYCESHFSSNVIGKSIADLTFSLLLLSLNCFS